MIIIFKSQLEDMLNKIIEKIKTHAWKNACANYDKVVISAIQEILLLFKRSISKKEENN